MLSARRIAIGVPLLVVSGIAAQVVYSSKVSGDMVAAHWDSGFTGMLDVIPANTDDARAYAVLWRGCTPDSSPQHSICTFASGLAPRSVVKTQQVDTLGLDLDISMLSVVFSTGGQECTFNACTPFTPASVPLHGTFTIYRGSGSSVEQSNGSTRTDTMFSVYPGTDVTNTQAFTGSRTKYSANFTGTVGLATAVPVPNAANGSVTIMKGQQSSQTVYSSAP